MEKQEASARMENQHSQPTNDVTQVQESSSGDIGSRRSCRSILHEPGCLNFLVGSYNSVRASYSRLSRDVTAVTLVYRTIAELQRHFVIVFFTNMYNSSRKWKPRISLQCYPKWGKTDCTKRVTERFELTAISFSKAGTWMKFSLSPPEDTRIFKF